MYLVDRLLQMSLYAALDPFQHCRPFIVGLVLGQLLKPVACNAAHQQHVFGSFQSSTLPVGKKILEPGIFGGIKGEKDELTGLAGDFVAFASVQHRRNQPQEKLLAGMVGECARVQKRLSDIRSRHGVKEELYGD